MVRGEIPSFQYDMDDTDWGSDRGRRRKYSNETLSRVVFIKRYISDVRTIAVGLIPVCEEQQTAHHCLLGQHKQTFDMLNQFCSTAVADRLSTPVIHVITIHLSH